MVHLKLSTIGIKLIFNHRQESLLCPRFGLPLPQLSLFRKPRPGSCFQALPSRLSTVQNDVITCDRRKPAQFWDRKPSQDTKFKECPYFRRRPLGSKHAMPGFWKNQYQGQRRSVWGFEAESQEIQVSGGYNKDQSTTSGRKERTQGRDGDKEPSILGHEEINSSTAGGVLANG